MFIRLVLVLICCFALSSCRLNKSERLVLTSSTEFLSLAESLSFGFREESGILLIVKGSFGQEKRLLKNRLTDFLVTSNELICRESEIKCLEIGIDQLVLIINLKNPQEKISLEELVKIFSGQIKSWEDKQKIQVLNRESSSSLKTSFNKFFLKNVNTFNPSSIIVNSNNEMKTAVSGLENSIGYISIGSLKNKNRSKGIKQLKIYHKSSQELMVPPKHQIRIAYLESNRKKDLKEFISFLNSNPLSKELVKQNGYLVL